jgi:hypothetical protein
MRETIYNLTFVESGDCGKTFTKLEQNQILPTFAVGHMRQKVVAAVRLLLLLIVVVFAHWHKMLWRWTQLLAGAADPIALGLSRQSHHAHYEFAVFGDNWFPRSSNYCCPCFPFLKKRVRKIMLNC